MSDDKQNDDVIDVEPHVIEDVKPAVAQPGRSNVKRVLGFGAALALGSAVLGGWLYRDVLANYLPNDQLQVLNTRVDALESGNKQAAKRVDAVIALTDELKAKLGAAQAASDKSAKQSADVSAIAQITAGTVSDLQQTLDAQKKALSDVQAKLESGSGSGAIVAADPALTTRIEALEKQLATRDAAPPPNRVDGAQIKQALDHLKAKAAAGQGFLEEASALQKLVPAADGFDVLTAEASLGLPNATQLSDMLAQVVPGLPKPQPSTAAGASWTDRIGAFFSNLVSVKSLSSDDVGQAAAKASAFAASGDLPQAVDVLGKAEAALPSGLQAWRDTATRRIKLDQAIAKITAAVAREVAAKG